MVTVELACPFPAVVLTEAEPLMESTVVDPLYVLFPLPVAVPELLCSTSA